MGGVNLDVDYISYQRTGYYDHEGHYQKKIPSKGRLGSNESSVAVNRIVVVSQR